MTIQQMFLGTAAGGGGGGIVTSGLVTHLDAGNAASYPGSGATWTDLTGNGNNGTLTNGPTYSAANGGQIVFDGVNDYVSVSYTQPSMVANTIEVWFKTTSAQNGDMLVQNRGSGAGMTHGLGINTFPSGGGPTGVVGSVWTGVLSNGLMTAIRSVATNFNDDNWRQVVGVFSQPTGTTVVTGSFNVYGNGSLLSSSTDILQFSSTNSPIGPGLGNLNLMRYEAGSVYTAGSLSIVRFYNRALSDSEVAQNFNAQKARFGL